MVLERSCGSPELLDGNSDYFGLPPKGCPSIHIQNALQEVVDMTVELDEILAEAAALAKRAQAMRVRAEEFRSLGGADNLEEASLLDATAAETLAETNIIKELRTFFLGKSMVEITNEIAAVGALKTTNDFNSAETRTPEVCLTCPNFRSYGETMPGAPATVMSITQYAQNLVNNTQSVAALVFE